jgi:hypothetical protein
MADPAAIQAELVDVRNVGFNKSVKLTLHVPAEFAKQVLDIFGWPTAVDPVPVAVARLNGNVAMSESDRKAVVSPKWMAQRAALLCKDPRFRAFLQYWSNSSVEISEDAAAREVRQLCLVASRSEIMPGTPAGETFDRLLTAYEGWLRDAR